MDRFTVGTIVLVVALVVAAVVVVNLGSPPDRIPTYREENTPEAVVHDLVVATVQEDMDRLRELVTRETLEWWAEQEELHPVPPLPQLPLWGSWENMRVRILRVEPVDPDKVQVTLAIDRFQSGGLFNTDVWTETVVLTVVREDGRWKVDLVPARVRWIP